MPIEGYTSRQWRQTVTRRLGGEADADAERVADAIVAIWLEIDQALHPIIGYRGVAALFNRSLKIATGEFAWLGGDLQGARASLDAAALKATLLLQAPDIAMAGGIGLLVTFHELLASLVGPSLTDQLLCDAWTQPSGVPPEQETSP